MLSGDERSETHSESGDETLIFDNIAFDGVQAIAQTHRIDGVEIDFGTKYLRVCVVTDD